MRETGDEIPGSGSRVEAPGFDAAAARRTLYRLALPVLAELYLGYCVGLYDTFLAGRFGDRVTHAVGFAAYVSWLVSMMFGIVSTGTTALVARFWGMGDVEAARRVLNRSVALALVMGTVMASLVAASTPALTMQLGMDAEGRAVAVRYLRFEAIGFLFTGVTLAGSAALRGSGNTRTPMLILGSVSVINVFTSSSLVFGFGPIPRLGVDGIVTGTVIARGCGALLMLATLLRGSRGLQIIGSELRLWDDTVRRIVRIGLPAVVDGMCVWAGQYLFLMIVGRVAGGQKAAAAHMIGVRVEEISYLPALACGIASAALIGQSLGRGDPEAARRIGHMAARQGAILAAFVGVAFFFGAGPVYALMHDDPEVRAIGIPAFRLLSLFQPPLAVAIVYIQALRGAGDTRSPMVITAIGMYGVRLPLAWVGGILLDGGLIGAWCGMFGDVSLRALLVSLRYAAGKWLRTEV